MQLHQIKIKNRRRKGKRVGRGGKRGTTAGRGTKGQKARAGHRIRPEIRDLIKRLPKRRGYGKNRARTVNVARVKPVAIRSDLMNKLFPSGGLVTPQVLVKRGVIKFRGKVPVVKIVGGEPLASGIKLEGFLLSKSLKNQ